MSKGYGVFGHVPDNADDDGLLPYEDDDSGVSWGHALRRRRSEEHTSELQSQR